VRYYRTLNVSFSLLFRGLSVALVEVEGRVEAVRISNSRGVAGAHRIFGTTCPLEDCFFLLGAVAAGALLYQGKTGGKLLYEPGVGMTETSGSSRKDSDSPRPPNPDGQRALADSVQPEPARKSFPRTCRFW
jgi:hypothetical protein